MDQIIEGVIFDIDGTLVDSNPIHFETIRRVADKIELDLTWEFFKDELLGGKLSDIFNTLMAYAGADITEEKTLALIDEYKTELPEVLKTQRPTPILGAIELLKDLQAAKIPYIGASNSTKEDIERILFTAGVIDFLPEVVTSEQVKNAKPAPDMFIEAARRVTADIHRCIIFEDSKNGLTAAQASGAYTVAILSSMQPAMAALYEAEMSVKDFTEVNIPMLRENLRLFATQKGGTQQAEEQQKTNSPSL